MALSTRNKSFITLFKIKKAIKSALKKSLHIFTKTSKKNQELERVNFDIEINENLQNEALEARLRQIIQASPASLDLEHNPSLHNGVLLLNEDTEIQFGTFWTGGEEEDLWDLYPHLCSFNSNMKANRSARLPPVSTKSA
ncbi:uncharacterized protein LOC125178671 [Hyalella azteca]|uniref:Uncharacterized protein LOC125178671 n=1 Tax=Hyalella azteca TaxID=294128 RepID=A0A979FPD1_HYAAZ|nr:uncharacterized protein LOC125178671 [Hyalella azteca]